jgi:NodT family efflux transporter outer membrane factor (OMF) lipoprotein
MSLLSPVPIRSKSKIIASMAIFFVLACTTGCTSLREYYQNGFKVGPNYCPPCAQVADRWIDEKDPNVSTEPPNDASWWETFNDPVLDSLIQSAYRQNLTLKVAGLRILEARAQRGIAVGNIFPQTQQATGDYTRTNNSKNAPFQSPNLQFDEWTVGANLAWELDFWGRFRRAVTSADARLDASIYNYDDVLVLLLAEVAQQYVNVRTAEQRLKYAHQNVKDQRQSLDLAVIKYTNGATTKLDVTQGQSNLSQTEATIPPLESARRQAANQICILLAMPPWDIEEMLGRKSIPSASPRVAVGVPADLLRRRPDIRRAERDVAAQSEQIGIATAELYPHFSISGNIFFDAEKFKDLFTGDSLAGNVGPSFNWNVLNYGRLVNNIRVQDARTQQLVLVYQDTVLKANAEAENSLIGFLKFQQQVKYLETSTKAAKESLELVRIQYDQGKTDFNRVLNVEQLLTQQEDQLAVSQGSVAQNLVLLYKALGGGWQIRLGNDEQESEEAAEETEETKAEKPEKAVKEAAPEELPEPAAIEKTPPQTPQPPPVEKE